MRLLLSFPHFYYQHKMSSARMRYNLGFMRHADVNQDLDVYLSGPGWPNWNDKSPLAENVERVCGGEVDWISAYKPEGDLRVSPFMRREDCSAKIVVPFNEAYWDSHKAWHQCKIIGVDLVICHHQNDLARFNGLPGEAAIPTAHIPHAAEPLEHYGIDNLPWSDRTGSLLIGVTSKEFYPLRSYIGDNADELGVTVRKHPGYRVLDRSAVQREEREYMTALSEARVAICTGSIYNYGLAKYAEAAMAGCAIVGDRPPDISADFPMYEINTGDSLDDVSVVLARAVADNAGDMGAAAQRYAMKHWTVDSYVKRTLKELRSFNSHGSS